MAILAVDEQKAVRSFASVNANERAHASRPLPNHVNSGSADVERVVEVDRAKPVTRGYGTLMHTNALSGVQIKNLNTGAFAKVHHNCSVVGRNCSSVERLRSTAPSDRALAVAGGGPEGCCGRSVPFALAFAFPFAFAKDWNQGGGVEGCAGILKDGELVGLGALGGVGGRLPKR